MSPKPPKMVPIGIRHAPVVAGLSERCLDDTWSEAAVGSVLATPGAFGFMALDCDIPEAFILCRAAAGECEVLALGTAPERRRQGTARRLVELALARAGDLGAQRMVLEVAEDNSAARDLYARCGFSMVGRRARYYRRPSGRHADALILSRD